MPEYWFVIRAENHQLYEALRSVLHKRAGYHLIRERRLHGSSGVDEERRKARVWEADDILIAETSGGDS